MIGTPRIPTSTELPLPAEYEGERSKWLFYPIESWDNLVQTPYQVTAERDAGTVVVRRGNLIEADTDFIPEEGRITAMRLVLGPGSGLTEIAGTFGAFGERLKPSATFGVTVITHVEFGEGNPTYTYHSEVLATNLSSIVINGYERAEVSVEGEIVGNVDVINYNQSGQYDSLSDLHLYGERHNINTAGQNYLQSMVPVGSDISGDLHLKNNLQYNVTRAFPIEVNNPQKLMISYSWLYGCLTSNPEFDIFGTIYRTTGNPVLDNHQLYEIQVTGVCVLFEQTRSRVSSVQFKDERLLYAREEGGGIVTRRATWTRDGALKMEVVNTTGASSVPSLSLQSDNSVIRSRRDGSGAIVLESSINEGATWD